MHHVWIVKGTVDRSRLLYSTTLNCGVSEERIRRILQVLTINSFGLSFERVAALITSSDRTNFRVRRVPGIRPAYVCRMGNVEFTAEIVVRHYYGEF